MATGEKKESTEEYTLKFNKMNIIQASIHKWVVREITLN